MEQVCAECHEEIAQRQQDGVHEKAIAEGNLDAATCFDCHGNHAIQDPDLPRERVSQTCGKCHSDINDQYTHSVHGKALLGEDNPDVPVCTDCHGVHNIADPTTAQFRLSSPEMCGKCHADETKMAKYDISTDVFNTYVADFHGTTVELFDKQTPDQETNKAVCYDCHGIHNIMATKDEGSQVVKENLLVTCQKCHPDANGELPRRVDEPLQAVARAQPACLLCRPFLHDSDPSRGQRIFPLYRYGHLPARLGSCPWQKA